MAFSRLSMSPCFNVSLDTTPVIPHISYSPFNFNALIRISIQALIKSKPPIGVTGPKKESCGIPIRSLIASRYIENENKNRGEKEEVQKWVFGTHLLEAGDGEDP